MREGWEGNQYRRIKVTAVGTQLNAIEDRVPFTPCPP